MRIEFIEDVIKATLAVSFIAGAFLSFFIDLPSGLGVLAGAVWSCANLFFIKALLQSFIGVRNKNKITIGSILLIKFPLLYLIGYWLLNSNYLPAESLLIGFSLILLVVFAKILLKQHIEKAPT